MKIIGPSKSYRWFLRWEYFQNSTLTNEIGNRMLREGVLYSLLGKRSCGNTWNLCLSKLPRRNFRRSLGKRPYEKWAAIGSNRAPDREMSTNPDPRTFLDHFWKLRQRQFRPLLMSIIFHKLYDCSYDSLNPWTNTEYDIFVVTAKVDLEIGVQEGAWHTRTGWLDVAPSASKVYRPLNYSTTMGFWLS